MDYEKMWRTLKAESGYRKTIDIVGNNELKIKDLMDNIEKRG